MVHWSMKNDSRVADALYNKRGCLVLQDIVLFSLYLVSCIGKQQKPGKQLRHWTCLDSSVQTSSVLLS